MSRFQIGLKGAGRRPFYCHPLRGSQVFLHPEKLFDQTKQLTYPLLIALLIPAHPLLFASVLEVEGSTPFPTPAID